MFHWEDGLKLTRAGLAIDFRRRQSCAFVSHAHTDHIARHELALCTPETALLYELRLGPRPTLQMPYRQPIEWNGLRLTTFPAGHCLGSAMLLAEDGKQSLLYTGDFKLSSSATAGRAELPRADILVIESTYGDPRYRLPARQQVITQLLEIVHEALDQGEVPVVLAYVLGKAQEVTRLLTDAGIPVLQHPKIYEVSRVYEKCGVKLGRHELFTGRVPRGWAMVFPPHDPPSAHIPDQVRLAVTGWAVDPDARYRYGADYAIPLSDHADYEDLLKAVERVSPRKVYCTHGTLEFVQRLREAGYDALPLGRPNHRRVL